MNVIVRILFAQNLAEWRESDNVACLMQQLNDSMIRIIVVTDVQRFRRHWSQDSVKFSYRFKSI